MTEQAQEPTTIQELLDQITAKLAGAQQRLVEAQDQEMQAELQVAYLQGFLNGLTKALELGEQQPVRYLAPFARR